MVRHDKAFCRSKDVVSEYTKVVNNALKITVKFRAENKATVTFQNTLKNRPVEVNPQQVKQGWLSLFGFRQQPEQEEEDDSETRLADLAPIEDEEGGAPVTIFLGYLQFFGYLVHNYSIRHGSHDAHNSQANESLWVNSLYTTTYDDSIAADNEDDNNNTNNSEHNDEFEARIEKIQLTPFMKQSLDNPLIIGGKISAVNDLVVEKLKTRENVINSNNRYLLQDLISPFNSIPTPQEPITDPDQHGFIPLHELTDNFTPFYATPQSLMFSELHIAPKLSASFEITLPQIQGLPPSYNTHMTAPLSDQGWVSLQYRLIVGFNFQRSHEDPVHKAVYFPYSMRMSIDETMNGGDYLQNYTVLSKFDNDWVPEVNQSSCSQKLPESTKVELDKEITHLLIDSEKRKIFLDELDNLINLDIYEITKQSSLRKKSIAEPSPEEMAKWNRRPLPSLKNKFQIRVNNHDLCIISLPRTSFQLGSNILFAIDLNPTDAATTKVVGVTVHLEAIEKYHVAEAREKFHNRYKVTPTLKLNTMSCSLLNSVGSNIVRGYINVPQFITPEFRITNFMDLRYQLSFKFVIVENADGPKATVREPDNQPTDSNLGHSVPHDSSTDDSQLGQLLDSNESSCETRDCETSFVDFIHNFQHDNSGTDMRFKFPVVVLP